jgi:hypothetical protein
MIGQNAMWILTICSNRKYSVSMPTLAQLLLRNDLFYRLAASKALAELSGAESGLRQRGSWSRETDVDCCVGMEDECMSGDIHGICPVEAVSKFYDDSFHLC